MTMIGQNWIEARKGRYNGKCTKIDMMAVCARQIQEQSMQDRYNNSLHKAVWRTANEEEYFERLILRSIE